MYRNSSTIPWHQDEQRDWVDVRLTKALLSDFELFNEIHDLGCGTGDYLDLICHSKLADDGQGFGYDISQTACRMAGSRFPNYLFGVLDLTASKQPVCL